MVSMEWLSIPIIAFLLDFLAVIILLIPQLILNPNKLAYVQKGVHSDLLKQLKNERIAAVIAMFLILLSGFLKFYNIVYR